MQIILMCKEESATSVLRAERINGEEAPDRQYQTVNHVTTLSGHSDNVLHHDCEDLLRNPIFRMPTPAEQDEMAGRPFKIGELQESVETTIPIVTEDVSNELEQAPDAEQPGEEVPSGEPPALDTTSGKKKASGG